MKNRLFFLILTVRAQDAGAVLFPNEIQPLLGLAAEGIQRIQAREGTGEILALSYVAIEDLRADLGLEARGHRHPA